MKIERGKRREEKRREVTWRDAEEEEEEEEERPENGGDCKETDDMETENKRDNSVGVQWSGSEMAFYIFSWRTDIFKFYLTRVNSSSFSSVRY